MSQIRETTRIQVAAPDGPSAFMLERRLLHLSPVTIESHGEWSVELDVDDRLDEVEAAVRSWLRESALESTAVVVDGRSRHIAAKRAA